MHGVEFGDRGVDVFDVEPDLKRDPTLLVDAVYLEEFVGRRTGARVGGANLKSRESEALASHSDKHIVEPHLARLEHPSVLTLPVVEWDVVRREADDLPSTLKGGLGCKQPLELVPVAPIDSSRDAFTRSHARSVELDNRR